MLEVGVDDGAERVRHGQAGQQFRGRPGRHGEDHAVVRFKGLFTVGEGEARDLAVPQLQAGKAPAEADVGARSAQPLERRIDEGRGQARRRDARMDAAAALGQGLAHHGAGKIGRCFLGRRVQHRQEQGPQEALPQIALAGQHLVDPPAGMAPHQARDRDILADPCLRNARDRNRGATTE